MQVQCYEALVKALLIDSEVSGTLETAPANLQKRMASVISSGSEQHPSAAVAGDALKPASLQSRAPSWRLKQ